MTTDKQALQQKLKNAAKVVGVRVHPYRVSWDSRRYDDPPVKEGLLILTSDGDAMRLDGGHFLSLRECFFEPHTNNSDSRLLEIALRKHCFTDNLRPFSAWPQHMQDLWERYSTAADSGSAEQYRAAVLDLAAAIGEMIDE